MNEYSSLVDRCRSKRLNRVVSNLSLDHAQVLFEHLFWHAHELNKAKKKNAPPVVIRLRDDDGNPDFYKDFSSAIAEVLAAGIEVRVIIDEQKYLDAPNSFLSAILRDRARGEVRVLGGRRLPHFLVVGSCAYRLEINPDTFEAKANFNDCIVSGELIERFDEIWRALPSGRVGVVETQTH